MTTANKLEQVNSPQKSAKAKKKTVKQIWEELFALIETGEKEKIEEAFATAEELNFDLMKKLEPWEKVIDEITIDSLVEFFSQKSASFSEWDSLGVLKYYSHLEEIRFLGKKPKLPKALSKLQKLRKITFHKEVNGSLFELLIPLSSLEEVVVKESVTPIPPVFWETLATNKIFQKISIKSYSIIDPSTYDLLVACNEKVAIDSLFISCGIVSMRGLTHLKSIVTKRGIGEFLGEFPSLTNLSLESYTYETHHYRDPIMPPCNINLLKNLQTLSLRDVYPIPDDIGALSELISLNIHSYNNIPTLPATIGNLSKLEKLSIGSKDLTSLPESIGKLTQLKVLDISVSTLSTLPDTIGNLTSLEEFTCHQNKSQRITLPDTIGNLKNLKKFTLESVQKDAFQPFPKSMRKLDNLEYLEITPYDNVDFIAHLNGVLENLKSLKKIYLWCKNLSEFPSSLWLLKSIKNLELFFGGTIEEIPDGIGNLTTLETLRIGYFYNKESKSGITTLPKSIGKLINLEELTIEHCKKFTTLPDTFCNLSKLKRLSVSECNLLAIPKDTGIMPELVDVWIDSNPILNLPKSVHDNPRISLGWGRGLSSFGVGHSSSSEAPLPAITPKPLTPSEEKNIIKELMALVHTGKREAIEEAFTIAEEKGFDLSKHLQPWKEVLPAITIDALVTLFSMKELTIGNSKRGSGKIHMKNLKYYTQLEELHFNDSEFSNKHILQLENLKLLNLLELSSGLVEGTRDLPSLQTVTMKRFYPRFEKDLNEIFLMSEKISIGYLSFWHFLPQSHLLEKVGNLKDVGEVGFNVGGFGKFPTNIAALTNIKKLTLRNYEAVVPFPDTIGPLHHLTHINMIGRGFSSLPPQIETAVNLVEFRLSGTFEVIPDTIGNLKKLELLVIKVNGLTALPQVLNTLPRLKEIIVEKEGVCKEVFDDLQKLSRITKVKHRDGAMIAYLQTEE